VIPIVQRFRRSSLVRLVMLLTLTAALTVQLVPPALSAPAVPPGSATDDVLRGRVLSRPGGYLSDPTPGDALDIALDFMRQNRDRFRLTGDDLSDIVLKDRYTTQHNGITHLYFRQRFARIEVFNGDININVTRDGRVLNMGSAFEPDLRSAVNALQPAIPAQAAVGSAAVELGLQLTEALNSFAPPQGPEQAQVLSTGGISYDPIPVKLMYQSVGPGQVRLAWDMTLRLKNNNDWLSLRVDAQSGKILSEVNFYAHGNIERLTDAHADVAHQEQAVATGPAKNTPSPANGVTDGSSYLVYPLPFDNPNDGARATVENPADELASPYGWHDTNGAAGAEYTITRGNNVHAYLDTNIDNQSDGGEPDGGAALDFAPPIDLNAAPATYQAASTVNLFYVNNRIHDTLFRLGFDEAAGNFQQTNYSGEGAGADYVHAEAQDGGGFANANFGTPPDGTNPRMQMYLGSTSVQLTATGSGLAGNYPIGTASFGAQSFDITGNLRVATDGGGVSTTDGCETITNDVVGRIALIDRGTCNFVIKVKNAQNAGAIGVVLVNNVPGDTPPGLGGTDPTITIPAVSVTQATGASFKTALQAGSVSVRMVTKPRTDGSLDNGVIIHEYGHGLSNRLTGGPSNSSCLISDEQAGEGWSDILALILTAQQTDTATQQHTIGTWLLNQPANGLGVRRFPYSTDMQVNGLTYDDIKGLSSVHSIGEIWNSMLWEVYWNLVNDYGFDADLLAGQGGNRLALQLIIDGMKLQPCNPTFVEARDAILAADVANNDGVNQCHIWEGFAKRGLGFSAEAGSTNSVDDGTEAFDLPTNCTLEITPAFADICIPQPAPFTVNIGQSFAGPVNLAASGSLAARATFTPPTVNSGTAALSINTAGAIAGTSTLTITGVGPTQTYTASAEVNLADSAPGLTTLAAPTEGATDLGLRPALSWNAVPQAASYLVELDNEPTFTAPTISATVRTNSFVPATSLFDQTTYYWRVTALNGCGSGVTSPLASFTTGGRTEVLLVEDTGLSNNALASYTAALDALGVRYDVWVAGNIANEPKISDLRRYSTVIWFGGYDLNGVPGIESEPTLATWLDSGRCLVFSVQELFARRDFVVTDFMRNYLAVDTMADDSKHTQVTGVAGSIFAGLGPLAMTYAGENYSDHMVSTEAGLIAFTGNGTGGNGAAITHTANNYRTVYMGFPLETLSSNNIQSVLDRSLDYCAQVASIDLAVEHTLTNPTAKLKPGQEKSYQIVVRNTGTTSATNVLVQLDLPAELQFLSGTSNNPALTLMTGTSPAFSAATLPPGTSATLTIQVRASETLTSSMGLPIRTTITGDGAELDTSDQEVLSTLAVEVPNVNFSGGSYAANEGTSSQAITVTLSAANPYADTTIKINAVGGTATAVEDFGLPDTTVTIPAGETSVGVLVNLAADRVTDPGETIQFALSDPEGAALASPIEATLTIGDVAAGNVLASATTLNITEGRAMTYTFVLDRQPTATVRISLLVPGAVTLSTEIVNLTPANWNVPQHVVVTAIDNNLQDGNRSVTISQSVSSVDSRFSGAPLGNIQVTIIDDDQPVVTEYRVYAPMMVQ
jgi:extracellular elastinolytic metalloproteinase